jgi:hypothetical protein
MLPMIAQESFESELRAIYDNFHLNDALMCALCNKLNITGNNFSDLADFIRNAQSVSVQMSDLQKEYSQLKETCAKQRNEFQVNCEQFESMKLKFQSQDQSRQSSITAVTEENNLAMDSLRRENESLMHEMKILEHSNNQLSTNLMKSSEKVAQRLGKCHTKYFRI